MISARDIAGAYAIIPTPAKEGSDRLDSLDTVDVDELERLVDALIGEGVAGLIALGTTGECATLGSTDYETFVHAFMDSVGNRVPTFVGASAPGGHEVVRRMSLLRDRGCTGTLLGPPMWQPVTEGMAADFYAGLSKLFPQLAVMVYANERVFRFGFGEGFWSRIVAQAPTVVAAKYLRPPNLTALLGIVQGRIHLLPSDMTVAAFHNESPATTTACWSTAACMGPRPVLALMDAVAAGDTAAIERISRSIAWANEPILPAILDRELFASHNIQIEKERILAAGYCRPGPVRPPYDEMPPALRLASRECGKRWQALCSTAQKEASP